MKNYTSHLLMMPTLLSFGILLVFPITTEAFDDERIATLVVKNGDKIPGEVVSAASGVLDWNCDLFASPVRMPLESIRKIVLPTTDLSARSKADYQIETVGGDLLFGGILKVSDSVVYLNSSRHGQLELQLSQIARIRNLKHSKSVVSGFLNFEHWGSLKNQKENWQLDNGNLYTNKKSANVYRTVEELPDSIEIALFCQFSNVPDFCFGFEIPRSTDFELDTLRIETWDGSLVLAHADGDFEILMEEIPEETRQFDLTISWNRKENEMIIRDHDQVLAQVPAISAKENSRPGFYFRNSTGDFRVMNFRVESGVDGAKPQLGSIVSASGESFEVEEELEFDGVEWKAGSQSIPASELSQVWLAETKSTQNPQVTLRYHDGEEISGDLESAVNDKLQVKTSFMASAMDCSSVDLMSIEFATAEVSESDKAAADSTHRMTGEFGTLHGQLAFAESGENLMQWTQAGSETAVKLAYETPFTIHVGKKSKAKPRTASLVDTLHLTNGDLIGCRIDSIDTEYATLLSPFGKRQVPVAQIKAIDLGQKQPLEQLAFDRSHNWRLYRHDGTHSECVDMESVRIRRGEKLVQPNFRGDQLKFTLRRNSKRFRQMLNYRMVLRLFNSDLDADSDDGVEIAISALGRNEFSVFGGNDRRQIWNSRKPIKLETNNIDVMVRLVDSKLSVSLNGILAYTKTIDIESQIQGSVLVFANASSESIGSLVSANGADWFDISNVQSEFLFGQMARSVIINQRRLDQLLTVPRAQRNYPPDHVIASTNGDFLRGKLKGLTGKKLAFESGSRDFSFDRDRISNIVWFQGVNDPEDEEIEETLLNSNQEVQMLLDSGERVSLLPGSFEDGVLVGKSSALGECSIELASIENLRYAGAGAQESGSQADYQSWVAYFAEPPHRMKAPAAATTGLSPLVGTTAIDFESVFAANGEAFKLSDLKGKVVVLDFWATWCGPCIASMPKLIRDIKSLDTDDVVLIAVNQGESAEKVNSFIKARDWDLNSILDEDSAIGELYKVTGIPKSVVITPDGMISAVNTGPAHDIKGDIERARKGELASAPVVVKVGEEAPEIESLYTTNQRQFRLSDLKGKVVVLDFWSTWSQDCISRVPEVISQVEQFASDDVVLVGVNQGENPTTINSFIKEKGWTLRSIQDPQMSIGQTYKVDALPRTIVVDRAGKIVSIVSDKEGFDLKSDIEKGMQAAGSQVR